MHDGGRRKPLQPFAYQSGNSAARIFVCPAKQMPYKVGHIAGGTNCPDLGPRQRRRMSLFEVLISSEGARKCIPTFFWCIVDGGGGSTRNIGRYNNRSLPL